MRVSRAKLFLTARVLDVLLVVLALAALIGTGLRTDPDRPSGLQLWLEMAAIALLVLGRGPGRRLGWLAAIAGVGLLTVGVITAQTGFSHEASTLALPATGALAPFAVGLMITTWRSAATARLTSRDLTVCSPPHHPPDRQVPGEAARPPPAIGVFHRRDTLG